MDKEQQQRLDLVKKLTELNHQLGNHDWYYEKSDDFSAWRRGNERQAKLNAAIGDIKAGPIKNAVYGGFTIARLMQAMVRRAQPWSHETEDDADILEYPAFGIFSAETIPADEVYDPAEKGC
tara:strand:- start:2486 stop:2851 length:366 start_codon:yes stop_codon:yes gene_type:complete